MPYPTGLSVQLVLYTGANCGLCDRLERLLEPYLQSLAKKRRITFTKRHIADDPQWEKLYGSRIPVLICDNQAILEGRPERKQIAAAIEKLG